MEDTAIHNRIRVTLSLKGDGAVPQARADALGEIVVGPHGFLGLLETQLGIPARDISFTARLIQYLGCIDQLDHGDAFYHASYLADPFSVARTLLHWRDQWYLAGWQGTFAAGVPARLADMAAIELRAATLVEPGLGQRIQRVIALLEHHALAIEAIELRDALEDFPYLWQRLIQAVAAPVTEVGDTAACERADSDLCRLQRHLQQQARDKLELRGDGTVLALRAGSPLDSTPLTAQLTQHWQRAAPQDSIAILAQTRGDWLDDGLEQQHNPRLGFTALSPWRPVFQVLPLACELLWEPLNPNALLQFLAHPVGPLPARIRAGLAGTVANSPGIGSPAWRDALAACLAEEDDAARRKLLASELHYWLESPRSPPQSGIDSDILALRARKVADWLQRSREAHADPARKSLYNIALNQAQEFIGAIERLKEHGRKLLTQDNVRRLIEDVRGSGAPVADRGAEVAIGLPRVLRADHAGAFAAVAVDNLIWWDCQANDQVQRWPWSRSEREALAAQGVHLHTEAAQLEWLGKAWLRPVLSARQRCIIVLHDDSERHHPLWDQITSVTTGLPILHISHAQTAARLGLTTAALQPRALPGKVRWWQLPASLALPRRDAESYSSLDAYIHSPYQWLLRYAARIRPGSLANVIDGNQLKGTLAHRLYEEFFNAHPVIHDIDTHSLSAWVDAHVGALLEQEGALLLEAGRQAECEQFIAQAQHSLVTLVEHLQSAAVSSVQMELAQQGRFAGGSLTGSIDLLATRANGEEAVVDIKWGGRRYRRESLLAASYLQLATYAQLRRSNGCALSPALSYFIVSDAAMLSLDHSFFPQADIIRSGNEESATDYWRRFEHTWRWRKAQFDRGRVEVTVSNTVPDADSTPGEDGLEMPPSSDGFNDYRALTGWEANA